MRRILFVDDEPSIVAGLGRMLRKFANGCEMVFAGSAAEALNCCATAPFDVVVSDARMPGTDGPALLQQIMRLYPDTVRIILSGQYEWDMALRSVGVAHQFLNKPCDPWTLTSTLECVCSAREHFRDAAARSVICGSGTLPSQPAAYEALVLRLECAGAAEDEVAQIIGSDVAMCATTAQLVGSGFFGTPQRTIAGADAARFLGLESINALVRSSSAFQPAKSSDDSSALERLNRHSLAVAAAAEKIAETVTDERIILSDAYTSGMLHDVGALALRAVVATPKGLDGDLSPSGYLAALWGLPKPIVEAVSYCLAPNKCPDQSFGPTTAVHAAHALLAHSVDDSPNGHTGVLDMEYLRRTGHADRLAQWREICATYRAEIMLT